MYRKIKEICRGSDVLAWLTLTNVGVWLALTILTLLSKLLGHELDLSQWLSLPGWFPIFITRPWTLLTYMFVQFDVLHLLFNVLWLYWFGIILLSTLSDRHLSWLYLGGGLAGGILFLVSGAAGWSGGWLCGSSAAVLAVMCGAALRLPDHQVNLFLIGAVRLKWIALVCCLLTLVGGGGNQAAHIGGILYGLAFGLMLRQGKDITKLRLDNLFRKGKASKRSARKMVSAIERQRADHQRLDQLLDKIKISGYESLSRREKKELMDLSSRLKR